MKVWVVLDVTEWSRDIVGVFATRDAAIRAMDRMTSWAFSIEEWEVETSGARSGSPLPATS